MSSAVLINGQPFAQRVGVQRAIGLYRLVPEARSACFHVLRRRISWLTETKDKSQHPGTEAVCGVVLPCALSSRGRHG